VFKYSNKHFTLVLHFTKTFSLLLFLLIIDALFIC
jgi:hypothetical protein